jgi:acetylglutamate synthase
MNKNIKIGGEMSKEYLNHSAVGYAEQSMKNWKLKWLYKNKIRHYQRELNKIK